MAPHRGDPKIYANNLAWFASALELNLSSVSAVWWENRSGDHHYSKFIFISNRLRAIVPLPDAWKADRTGTGWPNRKFVGNGRAADEANLCAVQVLLRPSSSRYRKCFRTISTEGYKWLRRYPVECALKGDSDVTNLAQWLHAFVRVLCFQWIVVKLALNQNFTPGVHACMHK